MDTLTAEKPTVSTKKGDVIQDPFLNALRREHVPVAVYLVNGIKLQGVIDSFDNYALILRNTLTQLVYKHAISTIVPSKSLKDYPGFSPEEATRIGIPPRTTNRQ